MAAKRKSPNGVVGMEDASNGVQISRGAFNVATTIMATVMLAAASCLWSLTREVAVLSSQMAVVVSDTKNRYTLEDAQKDRATFNDRVHAIEQKQLDHEADIKQLNMFRATAEARAKEKP